MFKPFKKPFKSFKTPFKSFTTPFKPFKTPLSSATRRGLSFAVLSPSVAILSLGISLNAGAHSRWVVPSHSVLSGDKPEAIAIDFSISNDIFHADLPMGGKTLEEINDTKTKVLNDTKAKTMENPMAKMLNATQLNVTTPDGKKLKNLPFVNLMRKSASSLMLKQSGTYRIDVVQAPVDVTWFKDKAGEYDRIFGPHADAQKKIPEGATDIETWRIFNNIQTYVTRNDISDSASRPTGKGLELTFKTHPSELFTQEKYTFGLTLSGKALNEEIDVKLTRHNTRYRNKRNSLEPKTNKSGEFSVNFNEAGLYLLEAEVKVPSTDSGVSQMYSLFVTLEVNPE